MLPDVEDELKIIIDLIGPGHSWVKVKLSSVLFHRKDYDRYFEKSFPLETFYIPIFLLSFTNQIINDCPSLAFFYSINRLFHKQRYQHIHRNPFDSQ